MSDLGDVDFSTILASSVHDMKNSVHMLLDSLDAVIGDSVPKDEAQKREFESLQYQAMRINANLVQLLTLYRNDNGLLSTRIDEHCVCEILEEQLALNAPLISTKGLSCTIECDEALHWDFDENLIASVINNVLVNCIRYAKNYVCMQARVVANRLHISIADDGPGYPQEMIAQPTCRATQADVKHGATHLGLFFVKKIAEMHKKGQCCGEVSLSNSGKFGSGEFRLTLP